MDEKCEDRCGVTISQVGGGTEWGVPRCRMPNAGVAMMGGERGWNRQRNKRVIDSRLPGKAQGDPPKDRVGCMDDGG